MTSNLQLSQETLTICTAYEAGFGDGLAGKDKACPYAAMSDAGAAWRYGKEQGSKKRAVETSYDADDAMRYRWLRDTGAVFTVRSAGSTGEQCALMPIDRRAYGLDEAVDREIVKMTEVGRNHDPSGADRSGLRPDLRAQDQQPSEGKEAKP